MLIRLIHFFIADDVTFGLVLSGRTLPLDNVEGIQGPCLTTVPFRFRADSAKSSAELLKTTQKAYAAVLPHQHTSLPAISRWLGVEQNLFDTLFSYLPKAKAATTLWEQKSSSMETGVSAFLRYIFGGPPAFGTSQSIAPDIPRPFTVPPCH